MLLYEDTPAGIAVHDACPVTCGCGTNGETLCCPNGEDAFKWPGCEEMPPVEVRQARAQTVGNPAESIQFSVRWGDECLVGQVGPSTGDPVVAVMPGLATERCLIGDTRPIDW